MTSHRPPTWYRRRLASVALAGLVLGACGSDSPESAATPAAPAPSGTSTGSAATAPAVTAPASPDPAVTEPAATEAPPPAPDLPQPHQVDVSLDEYALDIPAEIPSGFVRLSATNIGAATHHVVLARINDLAYADWLQVFQTNAFAAEGMLAFVGGPNGVEPGATVSAEMNLVPGEYVALSLMPNSDGVSEATLGMIAPVTVTEGGKAADLAALDIEGTVTLTEYAFDVSAGLDGHGRVLITNAGAQVHELVITRIGAGGSFEAYRDALAAGSAPNAPDLLGDYVVAQGVAAISPGVSIVADLDLEGGDYVFSCLAPDYGDFLPHTMHGMIALVHVPTT